MKKVFLSFCFLFVGLTVFAEFARKDPRGSYRWDRMPDVMRSNVLEQVATRRTNERLVVLRKSIVDFYLNEQLRLGVSKEVLGELKVMEVEGARVQCDAYPRFKVATGGMNGVLVYRKYARPDERRYRDRCYEPETYSLPEEHHVLCLLDRTYGPMPRIRSRVRLMDPLREQFCTDFWSMPETDFVRKYGLETLFSNSVYRVREGCMMVVDYSAPQDEEIFIYRKRNGVLDNRYEIDRQYIAERKQSYRGFIGFDKLLILSQEEASELVALVGWQWYEGNDAKYRDLRREYPWFLPVDVDHPKTQLGQELKATIERKERMARR